MLIASTSVARHGPQKLAPLLTKLEQDCLNVVPKGKDMVEGFVATGGSTPLGYLFCEKPKYARAPATGRASQLTPNEVLKPPISTCHRCSSASSRSGLASRLTLNAGKHTANQPARLAHLDDGNHRAILVQGHEGPAQIVRLGHRGTPSIDVSDEIAILAARPIASLSGGGSGFEPSVPRYNELCVAPATNVPGRDDPLRRHLGSVCKAELDQPTTLRRVRLARIRVWRS
jgi:hypothetical protein